MSRRRTWAWAAAGSTSCTATSRAASRARGGDGHVMKLNYTSLQHAVTPLEERPRGQPRPRRGSRSRCCRFTATSPVRHSALSAQRCRVPGPDTCRPPGGALPGELSDTVADMLERGLLAGHVTAGAAHGAPAEAITVEGALDAGRELGWDCALVGPGPGFSVCFHARPRRARGARERPRRAGARLSGRHRSAAVERGTRAIAIGA